ncbi:MAG: hypothetical protein HY355_07010 [Armatimonadetes bacterium]|nr:hypothetical protein [Armatimonadota bacterium]
MAAVLILAVAVPGATVLCPPLDRFSAERAAMRYVAALTANWDRRPPSDFAQVATRRHATGLDHPGTPARAIFSPYLQQARFDRIETGCRRASVEMTVWTGFNPRFIVPREVTLELALENGQLKVDQVIGR